MKNEKFEINPEIAESIAAEDDFVLSSSDDMAVNYFVEKFESKMSGSVPSIAAWWVDGISELSPGEKAEVFRQIRGSMDLLARDRGAEHDDFPSWILDEIKKYRRGDFVKFHSLGFDRLGVVRDSEIREIDGAETTVYFIYDNMSGNVFSVREENILF